MFYVIFHGSGKQYINAINSDLHSNKHIYVCLRLLILWIILLHVVLNETSHNDPNIQTFVKFFVNVFKNKEDSLLFILFILFIIECFLW